MHTLFTCFALIFVVICIKWSAQHASYKRDVEYAVLALEAVKKVIVDKLGPKGLQVFSLWENGLNQISDESMDEELMVGVFFKYLRIHCNEMNLVITPIEFAIIKQAVITTIKLACVKPGPTKAAVKIIVAMLPVIGN